MNTGLEFPSFVISVIALLVTVYVLADTTKIRKFQNSEKEKMQVLAMDSIYNNIFAMINNLELLSVLGPNNTSHDNINMNILHLYEHVKSDLSLHIDHFSDKQIVDLKSILTIFETVQLSSKRGKGTFELKQITLEHIVELFIKFIKDHCTDKQYSELLDFLKTVYPEKY